MGLTELLGELPLPLAQLVVRALNAKSAADRHHLAYYLGETALKLCAASRVGLWMSAGPIQGPVALALNDLLHPLTGHWLAMARSADADLAARPDGLPFGAVLGRFSERQRWPAVAALAEAALDEGVVDGEVLRAANEDGLEGLFALLVAYRSHTLKVTQPPPSFCDRMATRWLAALEQVLRSDLLWGGARLAVRRERGWFELSGLGARPWQGDGPAAEGDEVPLGAVAFVDVTRPVRLDPMAAYLEPEDHVSERVIFLNGAVVRRKRGSRGAVERITRTAYLDYLTGAEARGLDVDTALQSFLSRVRGVDLGSEEYEALSQQTGARRLDELPIVEVSSGAALGRFRVVAELGRGAMGVVYRAVQESLGREVALKVLPPELASDERALGRFAREVHALGRCDHPNVVKVLSAEIASDRPHFAMEHVEGTDLGSSHGVLAGWRAGGGFYQRVARLFAGAAQGLHALHEQGALHRDVKPSNLMITADHERLVIMDLGLAWLDDATKALTRTGTEILGTLRYMAPEQLRGGGRDLDRRADVYGLGATLYEVMTGQPFYDGRSEERLLQQVANERPVPPRKADRALPAPLAEIIEVATARDREERYADANELAQDLRRFAEEGWSQAKVSGRGKRLLRAVRRHPVRAALLVIVLAALAVAGEKARAFYAGSVEHCAVVVRQWGAPVCAVPLTESLASRRWMSYRIERRRGLVTKVQRVNGLGTVLHVDPTTHTEDPTEPGEAGEHADVSHWLPVYDEHERIVRVEGLDHTGLPKKSWDYVFLDRGRAMVWYRDRAGRPRKEGESQVVGARLLLDERGRAVEMHYLNVAGAPRPLEGGIFGRRLERDEKGIVIREEYLSLTGAPQPNKHGVAGVAFGRDGAGNVVKRSNFGANGGPVRSEEGYAAGVFGFDGQGNGIHGRYLDPEGLPTLRAEGYAGYRARYDARGNQTEAAFLGIDGELLMNMEGIALARMEHDERGYMTRMSFFGSDGERVASSNGNAGLTIGYDRLGRMLEMTYLGADDKPALIKEGVAGWRATYDERGNQTGLTHLGVDGKPALHVDGNAGWRATHDERGNVTGTSFLSIDGEPALLKYGYAGWRARFDARGNRIERSYFGADAKPSPQEDGYATRRATHDEHGHEVRVEYLGADGRPTVCKSGYAGWTSRFDERGNEVERAFFGVGGKPTLHEDGFAGWRSRFDERSNEIERAFFGVDGEATLHENGNAGWRSRYDDRSNDLETMYFGIDGKPTLHSSGVAGWRSRFDERSKEVERDYFGVDGRPTLHKDGNAGWRARYDDFGNEVERVYRGVDGNPTLIAEGYAGYRLRRDSRGLVVESANIGVDGEAILDTDGVAGWRASYDATGNRIEEIYFGLDGKPKSHNSGYAKIRMDYDARGNRTRMVYYDTSGWAAILMDGVMGWQARYDARGNRTELRYFGPLGAEAFHSDGYLGWRATYDPRGNLTSKLFFGADGAPVRTKDGYASRRAKHDQRGYVTRVSYYDVDGSPVRHRSGYASWRASYDSRGNRIEESYFDVDGRPHAIRRGVATIRDRFDDRGNVVWRGYFDTEGRPSLHEDGNAGWRATYDSRGNMTERVFFGSGGEAVRLRGAYAVFRRVTDATGYAVLEASGGPDGVIDRVHRESGRKVPLRLPAEVDRDLFAVCSNLVVGMAVTGFADGSNGRLAGVMLDDLVVGYDGKPVRFRPLAASWLADLRVARSNDPSHLYDLEVLRVAGDVALRVHILVPGGLIGILLTPEVIVFEDPHATPR